jgi:Zn-dependent M28 family amino/carboxypeptidase
MRSVFIRRLESRHAKRGRLLTKRALVSFMALLLFGAVLAGPTAAGPVDRSQELRRAVTTEAVFDHLEAFDRIGRNNDDTRASGTPGYNRSLQYVRNKLNNAGYQTSVQEFDFRTFESLSDPELEQVTPTPTTYEYNLDFDLMSYSGSGDVTAPVTAVDYHLGPNSVSDSGCEPEDFDGFTPGHIALVQRGFCDFVVKAFNAQEAGASAIIIFNQGNTPDREGLIAGTLGPDPDITIPALGTTYAMGVEFIDLIDNGLTLRVFTETLKEDKTTKNLFAETATGNDNNVVMAGGHLDSVPEGPGVNDNGTGSAALLETALEMSDLNIQPKNTVRFAWWGAEEAGTLGSEHYILELTEEEAADIALYLNFDMVGSPNFARFIYDGNGSAFPDVGGGPEGSGAIERAFQRYFEAKGLPTSQTAFDGRSDYDAFINIAGIPAGGLFTGAEGIKTEQEAALYGGTAGEAYDPCYHQLCDDIDNVSKRALGQMSDAIAHTVYTFAMSTRSVNGVN